MYDQASSSFAGAEHPRKAIDAACSAAGLEAGNLEHRQLDLKGKSEPIGVQVLHVK